MNKKGNIFFSITIGIFLFVTGVLVMPFLADDITSVRTALQCSSSSISDGTKLMCIGMSGVMPYFIIFFTLLGIGYLIGRNK